MSELVETSLDAPPAVRDEAAAPQPQRPPSLARRHGGANPALRLAAAVSVAGMLLLIATCIGWSLRIHLWHLTQHVHYAPDMANAYAWGSRAHADGAPWAYVNLYENVLNEAAPGRYDLDYVPLRLWIMQRWVAWTKQAFPGSRRWQRDYEFNAPLLRLNAVMELAAALAAFGIVFVWLRRVDRHHREHPPALPQGQSWRQSFRRVCRGWGLPVVAFLLIWFNPATLISAHVRPTWDVWVVPFYLGAVLCAILNGWFTAGVLVGIGAMLKGQQLIVAPLFVLWPILLWRWGAALRAVIGCALAVGVIVSPWMLTYRPDNTADRIYDRAAIAWIAAGLLAVIVVTGIRWWVPWMQKRWRVVAAAVATAAVLIPALMARPDMWPVLLAGAIALALAAALLPLRQQGYTLAGVLGMGLLACMWLFHGGDAWFEIAFRYGGLVKFPQLEVGGSDSLAGLLQNRFDWRHDDIVFSWPAGHWLGRWPGQVLDVTMHDLLLWSLAILLVVSIISLAIQYRLRSERFLVAVAMPWVLFFAVAPLMHERYLLWGAMAAAVAVGAGWGPALLGVFLSIVQWAMSARQILGDGRRFGIEGWPSLGQDIITWIRPFHPGIAWAVLLATAVLLYLTLIPTRRRGILHP